MMYDLTQENIQVIIENGKLWINNERECLVRIQGIKTIGMDVDRTSLDMMRQTRCPNPECRSPLVFVSKSDEGIQGGCDDCGWSP